MNFLFREYVLNMSITCLQILIKLTRKINDKETVKVVIKFSAIKLIILLFFNNGNIKVGTVPRQRICEWYQLPYLHTWYQLSYFTKKKSSL